MRLFIAINFNEEIRDSLTKIQERLKEGASKGNFTHRENIHLTLVFIGECDVKEAERIKAIMDETPFSPFKITINQIGRFRKDDGDIWWVGLSENDALKELQRDLSQRLIKEGFPLENRKYSPHITLGRRVRTEERPWSVEPLSFEAKSFELMISERVEGSLVYAVYHTTPRYY